MKDIFYEILKDTTTKVYAQIQTEYTCRLHFHRAFELAYIYEGEAVYDIEDRRFVAETDHIVFSHCYYRHRSYDTTAHKKIVIAIPENLSRDVSALFTSDTLPMLLTDKEINKTLLPYFKALNQSDEKAPEILIKGYVNLIFGTLAAHYEHTEILPKSKNISILIDVLMYVEEHAAEPITLGDVASEFGYNKSYFSRLFGAHVGTSFSNYVNFVRLDRFEASRKENAKKSITEQIYEAGFQSVATFYRVKEMRKKE